MAQTNAGPRNTKLFTVFVVVALVLVFLSAYTRYIFAKDYFFYVEGRCDTSTQTCFIRDCEDYCPPNGLDTYSAYYIKAALYEQCQRNSCGNICRGEQSNKCIVIECDVDAGDSCSDPNS